MPIHQIKLLRRQEVAKQTLLFEFTKPPGLVFKPGQYASLTLLNTPEIASGANTRRFSILSTPAEDSLAIATRLQNSPYKQALNQLSVGSEIKFAGPVGNFVLPEDKEIPAVLIAGGIGIAPFYSMVKHNLQAGHAQPLYLFYGNQNLQSAAFLSEFQQLAATHSQFHFIPTMDVGSSEWQGETGFINDSMLKKYIPDLTQPIYYVCGAPMMVTALQEVLLEMEIAGNRIKVEDFPGY